MDSGHRVTFDAQSGFGESILRFLRVGPFAEQSVVLASPASITIIPAHRIVRVDLDVPYSPEFGVLDMHGLDDSRQEIDEERWERIRLGREEDDVPREARVRNFKAPLTVIGRLQSTTGLQTFLAHRIETPMVWEQHRFLKAFFALPAFAFRNIDGGLSLINPRHIVAATYHPGADPTDDAWHVNQSTVIAPGSSRIDL